MVAAVQTAGVVSVGRALSDGMAPEALRAVAAWNQRKSYDERRRRARLRHRAQAAALGEAADRLELLTHNDDLRRAA